jgi:hypothetical protein
MPGWRDRATCRFLEKTALGCMDSFCNNSEFVLAYLESLLSGCERENGW